MGFWALGFVGGLASWVDGYVCVRFLVASVLIVGR